MIKYEGGKKFFFPAEKRKQEEEEKTKGKKSFHDVGTLT